MLANDRVLVLQRLRILQPIALLFYVCLFQGGARGGSVLHSAEGGAVETGCSDLYGATYCFAT